MASLREGLTEFAWFAAKEARACLFAGLFFAAVLLVPRTGLLGKPRYDVLLLFALAVQAWLLASGRETWDEAKAIALFHALGLALEAFKTSLAVHSWAYPEFAYSKFFGVPLFSGFMHAAVGSSNFFTHHVMADYRWVLGAWATVQVP